jgi:hypothetical protein
MTSPFQPERSELPQPVTAAGNGLNTEYANLIQSTQKSSADKPQVVSADGSQLVIPPLAQTTQTTDQSAAPGTTGKPPTTADATQPASTTTTGDNSQTAPRQAAGEQQPQSVAYNPSLCVPSWQRFSQTPVDTNGNAMPADGPGSPGDSGPGPAIPMWMRLAPPGMISPQMMQAAAGPSNELASQNQATTDGANNQAGTDTTTAQTQTAQTDSTATPTTNPQPGGQTGALVT